MGTVRAERREKEERDDVREVGGYDHIGLCRTSTLSILDVRSEMGSCRHFEQSALICCFVENRQTRGDKKGIRETS